MDGEEQYDLWRREYANTLLKASQAVEQMKLLAPVDANPEWYHSRMSWCQQEAGEVWPDENSWPKGETAEIYDLLTRQRVNT
jgi:hypothetical protein